MSDFILGGSKIIADGDCSHEIKRCLLLGRKVMTNLDSILKSRDITLPTKVHLVKAMVFPVVTYGCESRTVKKAEHRRIDALELWCWSAGSQREESHPRQGHAERPDGQGESGLRGSPWVFLNIYPPPQTRVCLPYCTVFSTLLTLWKKLTQGFSLLHLKGMFQFKSPLITL